MKKTPPTYPLFTPSGCLSEQAFSQLASHSLSLSDEKKARLHLQSCSLCRDAFEGWSMFSDSQIPLDAVAGINKELLQSAEHAFKASNPVFRIGANKLYYFAAAAIIIILAGWLFFMEQAVEPLHLDFKTAERIPIPEKFVPTMPRSLAPDNNGSIVQPSPTIANNETKTVTQALKVEDNKTTPRAERKLMNEMLKISPDLKSGENGLEAYLLKSNEKSITETGRRSHLPVAIASNQPIDYYLAEVIIADRKRINRIDPSQNFERPDPGTPNASEDAGNDQIALSSHFFNPVETMPEFPGGYSGLSAYLGKNLKYPTVAKERKIQGRVIVSFLIDDNGVIKNITVLHGIGGGCDQEAIRVIRSMPAWQPAQQNGKAVSVQFTLPIHFRIL